MDCGVPRGCKTFKKDKLAKNDNITVCRSLINIDSNHIAFSELPVLKFVFSQTSALVITILGLKKGI